MLKHRTGEAARTCAARECEVVTVSKEQAREFYNAYHLQGAPNSVWLTYGLVFEDRLVACMSFNSGNACRGDVSAHLLQRFAAAGSVPGAASKLLAAFRGDHPGPIISYSDERYAPGGGLYGVLGFKELELYKPDYRYWKNGAWFAKNAKQRKHLEAELQGDVLPTDTEYTMAEKLGYLRCYDCGKKSWRLD
jgi:hypothetical protein